MERGVLHWTLCQPPHCMLPVFRPAAVRLSWPGGVILALTLLLIPQNLSVAGHSLRDLHLYYRPGLAGIATSVFLQDNWHLLGYLLPALLLMLMGGNR